MILRSLSLIIWGIIFQFSVAYAQSGNQSSVRDSLLTITESTNNEQDKAEAYLSLAKMYRYSQPDSAVLFTNLVIDQRDVIPLHLTGEAYLHKATTLFLMGQYQGSIETSQSGVISLTGTRDHEKLRADLIKIAGIATGAMGNYEVSLRQFLEAQAIYENLEDQVSINSILNNIGVTRLKLEDYEQALEIFLELDALDNKDPSIEIAVPVNLAFIYFELGQLNEAKKHTERALQILTDVDSRISGLFFLVGQIALEEGRLGDAEKAFENSIAIYNEQGNVIEQVQPLIGLSKLHLQKNDISIAWDYAEEALEIANEYNGLPEKLTAVEMLYLISKDRKQYSRALRYHELYKTLSDSLQNAKINQEVGRLSAAYEFSQKEQDLIKQQATDQLESQQQLNRQKTVLIYIFLILILALAIILFLYRNSIAKKKTNELLAQKNAEIEDKAEKLRQSNEVKNRLFSIIAHDLRGPLSSLQGMISIMEMNITSQEDIEKMMPEIGAQFKSTSTLLNNLLQWSQSQMDGYKVIPEKFDLIAILKQKEILLIDKLKKKKLSLTKPDGEYFVYADRNMTDLVLQNLISNAIKYCHEGGSIDISFSSSQNHLTVQIKDSGVGIPQNKLKEIFSERFYSTNGTQNEKGTGLGLMLCKDFVERNNGKIWVESELEKGSSFYFTIPHPPEL